MSTTDKTPYTVQPFIADIDASTDIAAIHLGIRRWQVEAGQNKFSNITDSQEDLRAIGKYYIEPGGNFFIAKDPKGKVLGFVGLRNDGSGQATLKRLAVLPEHQGQGIGSALIATLVAWVRSNDFKKVSLQTGENERARPIYKRAGFKEVGRLKRNGDYLMELDLTASSEE